MVSKARDRGCQQKWFGKFSVMLWELFCCFWLHGKRNKGHKVSRKGILQILKRDIQYNVLNAVPGVASNEGSKGRDLGQLGPLQSLLRPHLMLSIHFLLTAADSWPGSGGEWASLIGREAGMSRSPWDSEGKIRHTDDGAMSHGGGLHRRERAKRSLVCLNEVHDKTRDDLAWEQKWRHSEGDPHVCSAISVKERQILFSPNRWNEHSGDCYSTVTTVCYVIVFLIRAPSSSLACITTH